jgi:hypothetical protein
MVSNFLVCPVAPGHQDPIPVFNLVEWVEKDSSDDRYPKENEDEEKRLAFQKAAVETLKNLWQDVPPGIWKIMDRFYAVQSANSIKDISREIEEIFGKNNFWDQKSCDKLSMILFNRSGRICYFDRC